MSDSIPDIYVVIATAFNRNELLFGRSLRSVYNQRNVDKTRIKIIIVDDNKESQVSIIRDDVLKLRNELGISENEIETIVLENKRTRFNSGTGAWNTGIFYVKNFKDWENSFIAILDDDDEWLPDYLNICCNEIKDDNRTIAAVFTQLIWRTNEVDTFHKLTRDKLTQEEFYIGNPGVQGSNLFISTKLFFQIQGFDENYPNSTDRELMIRLLDHVDYKNEKDEKKLICKVIEHPLVIHYNHNAIKVNNDKESKKIALDLFYNKYKDHFSAEAFNKSLYRAKEFFGYDYYKNKAIVIGIALKNSASTIRRTIESLLGQENVKRELIIFIADDGSTDNWQVTVQDVLKNNKNIIIHRVNFGKTYKVRNYINRYVRESIKNVEYIGRLDADDYLCDNQVISKIEAIIDINSPDVILTGNKLALNGIEIDKVNYAQNSLRNDDFVKKILFDMSEGKAENELPSCNTFIKSTILMDYPEESSAEDHWLAVNILLNKRKYNIFIAENMLYSVYNLNGKVTSENLLYSAYYKSRKKLYDYFIAETGKLEYIRIDKAYDLLKEYKPTVYQYLGQGFSGVVFHDKRNVYKVHIPLHPNNYNEIDKLLYLIEKKDTFEDAKHFYSITDIFKFKGIYVLKYPYEQSIPINELTEDDYISFLTECWERKIICKSLTKENFIRVNGLIKMIDYEIDAYNDNLFLNMAARAFLQVHFLSIPYSEFNRLKRTAVNNFSIPELKGFNDFLKKVFSNIFYRQSEKIIPFYFQANATLENILSEEQLIQLLNSDFRKKVTIPYTTVKNFDRLQIKLFSENIYLESLRPNNILLDKNGYIHPESLTLFLRKLTPQKKKVSLIIKTCGQDSQTIIENVEHIIKQLISPDIFFEKILLIDNRETEEYLRQYTQKGSLKELYMKADRLISLKLIDKVIELPKGQISRTNKDWFGIDTEYTHTYDNIPVTTQLYGFESTEADYILQMDSDVMIGRRNYTHSFLNDMIEVCEKNPQVVSVAFGIPHSEELNFQDYFGFENGGFVPEVRMCLIDKKRLLALRPLPNEIMANGLHLSWYRSLEKHQKNTGKVSIRGGHTDSYFIHPQNYRKTDFNVWFTILDRVEQGQLTASQIDEFDLQSPYYNWAIPKRNEKIVALIILEDDIDFNSFLRCFISIVSQTEIDYGIIIINNKSEKGYDIFIKNLILPYNNITYVFNYFKQENTSNFYKAVHYFIDNPETIVIPINPVNYILGNFVFNNIFSMFTNYKADVCIGKELNVNKLYKDGMFDVNFITPSDLNSNILSDLKCFKKKLFDCLSIYDLKDKINCESNRSNFEKLSNTYKWSDDPYFSFIIPIIEMSTNPIRYDHANIIIDKDIKDKLGIQSIMESYKIKTRKNKYDFFTGRKKFIPNLNKIEIDITYDCNLKCIGCNRSCTQAPSNERMTIKQIELFVDDSIETGKKWELINILGGEPTMNPDFLEIIDKILIKYIDKYSPKTILQITSNGINESLTVLSRLPKHNNLVFDRLSYKSKNVIEYFTPFNDAPIDDVKFKDADFSKGCWVTCYCGIGLNLYGYYSCSLIAGIDRIIGMDRGIKSLKEINMDDFGDMLKEFCRYCGNFKHYDINKGDFIPRCEKAPFKNEVITKSWLELYKKYRVSKPNLTKIYDNKSEK